MWTDYRTVFEAIRDAVREAPAGTRFEDITVVHGKCPKGADFLAGSAVIQLNAAGWLLKVEEHPADWKRHRGGAGMIRNSHMVDLGAEVCLAFIKANSRGATDCAAKAKEAGIPVRYFRQD